MLRIHVPSRSVRTLAIHHVWFAKEPRWHDALRFAQYYHCDCLAPVWGFHRRSKFTSVVDLSPDDTALLESFSPNTRYEVRRAMREGFAFAPVEDLAQFCRFTGLAQDVVAPYWPQMAATQVSLESEVISMHSYLVDPTALRVALHQSVSIYRAEASPNRRSMMARANRWLHYRDMLWFKEQGFVAYDWGGISVGTQKVKLQQVNRFKEGFGGRLVELSNYVSCPVVWWNRLLYGREVTT